MSLDDRYTFYMIPKEPLDELIKAAQDFRRMQELLEKDTSSGALGDYIPEEEAMKLLGRGKTWFWDKRKSGELPGKKAAGRWYYRLKDIQKYIEDGRPV